MRAGNEPDAIAGGRRSPPPSSCQWPAARVPGSSPAVPPPAGPTVTVTEGTRTSTRSVTVIGEARSARPRGSRRAPHEPAPVVADCPYLSDDAVADINGQRTGVTTVVAVSPQPDLHLHPQ